MTIKQEESMWRVISLAINLLATIAIGVNAYTLRHVDYLRGEINVMRTDVAKMQGNYITGDDALEIWKHIAEVKERIAKLPPQIPPQWLLQKIDAMDSRSERDIKEINNRIERLENAGRIDHGRRPAP